MTKQSIHLKETALGIEFGSTRIKATLIDSNHTPVASGEYTWENRLKNGLWTYNLEEVWNGVQDAFQQVAAKVEKNFQTKLTEVGSIGISAMMHGYLPFDEEGEQLAAFRTWRNTNTEEAAEKLTELFQFNIPHRWSIAHLYQAILDKETHVKNIDFLTTLAGYVHWQLTGEKVLGVGEASGMFPIDPNTGNYNQQMIEKFNDLMKDYPYDWSLLDLLPKVKSAGSQAGELTKKGAQLLDPTETLKEGIMVCPPEGDAGTGMVATNSISEHTGNVSAGTSIFSMIVLEKDLEDYYKEIDIVTTPTGKPVAMVHCNNFTSDINDWTNLFQELLKLTGSPIKIDELLTKLFEQAMKADSDVGKLVHCNYYSGEPITGFEEGRPLFARMPDSKLTLANFMRSQIYAALATLKLGMDILIEEENVQVDYLLGHGGFFKTENVGQQIMADAIQVPISVMETASEGGPWGMAILASYTMNKAEDQSLEDYLEKEVFAHENIKTIQPTKEGKENFAAYMKRFKNFLEVEQAAITHLK